jgi:hypothetical protein
MHCSGLSERIDLNYLYTLDGFRLTGAGRIYANFLCWYAYLYLGHTHILTYKKGIRDELESIILYDQSYPCSASQVISCLRF